jgi:CDP-diacylglycerol--glycerol-3-phosphate 3-phosphatidyltransferase
MLRVLLVPFFFLAMYYHVMGTEVVIWFARALFVVIVVSDFLDGYLARRLRETSTLGSVIDPVADKLFVMASFVLLTVFDRISPWLTITVVAKDIIVSIGWCLMVMLYDKVKVDPSLLGKAATCLQFFIVFVIVMFPPAFYTVWLEFLTAGVTTAALIQYTFQAMQIASGLNGNSQ